MEKEKHDTPNRGIFKNLKSTYQYAKGGKKYLILFLFINILLTIISIVVPVLVAKRLVVLTSGVFDQLLLIIFTIFIIEIMRNIGHYFYNQVYNRFYYDVRKNLQLSLTEETLKITQEDIKNNYSGVFI